MNLADSISGAWRASIAFEPLGERARSSLFPRLYYRLKMGRCYLVSYYKCMFRPELFRDVKTYCAFIGHGRSGSTIVSALLDAHRHVIIADEVPVLGYLSAGFSRDQLFHILRATARWQARRGRIKGGREGKTYSYAVPGQWQGTFEDLQVIGARKAGTFSKRLVREPQTLDLLRKTMAGLPIRFIHVVRNPFDAISTMHLRSGRELSNAVQLFFSGCVAVARVEKRMDPSELFRVRHEAFLDRPQLWLTALCGFLGLEVTKDYLDACSSVLYKSPVRTRSKVAWSPELISLVHQGIAEFDFLEGYSFET